MFSLLCAWHNPYCRVGDYKVLKVLGAGSFAQVAVGENEKTGEKVYPGFEK